MCESELLQERGAQPPSAPFSCPVRTRHDRASPSSQERNKTPDPDEPDRRWNQGDLANLVPTLAPTEYATGTRPDLLPAAGHRALAVCLPSRDNQSRRFHL